MKDQQKKSFFIGVFKQYFRKEEALLIPNILCYFRLLLVVVFVILYLTDFTCCGNEYANVYFAAAVMMVAAYTDFIDGFIARTFNMKSNLGKALDPIADKLLQAAIAFSLCFRMKDLPSVILMFVVFALKEITLIFQDVYLARRNKSIGGAKWYGKVSTFLFYLILATLLLLGPSIEGEASLFHRHAIVDSLCTIAIFFLSLAWLLYSVDVHHIVKNGKEVVPVENEVEKHD